MLEYFLKPQLSPSVSGLMGFILGERPALNLNSNFGKTSSDALNEAVGLNSKILLLRKLHLINGISMEWSGLLII